MSPEFGKGRSAQCAEPPEALNELEPDGAVQESEELLSIIDFTNGDTSSHLHHWMSIAFVRVLWIHRSAMKYHSQSAVFISGLITFVDICRPSQGGMHRCRCLGHRGQCLCHKIKENWIRNERFRATP